jgi:type IV pilus assembly protein PilC
MSQFICRVGTTAGDIREIALQADTEGAARRELAENGYHIFSVRRSFQAASLLSSFRRGPGRIKSTEFVIFNQELAALLRAGLPLMQSLDIMLERMHNPQLRSVLADVRDKVKGGVSLSEAFRSHGDRFPRIYSASLLAGEKSGSLEEVIRRYVQYLKLTEATRRKVTGALIYPAFLFVFLIGAASVLLFKVVPTFGGFFESFDADLPPLTVALLTFANAVRGHYLSIFSVLILAGLAFFVWSRQESSRAQIDHFKLSLPYFGRLLRLFSTSQITRSLSTLLAGGIPLVQSIDIAAASIANRFVGDKVRPVSDRVREGKSFAASLEGTGQFDNIVVEMAKVGETTGSLAEMMSSVADFSDEEIENKLNIMMAMLTPLLLVVMGAFVAMILLALYLPLFGLSGALRH